MTNKTPAFEWQPWAAVGLGAALCFGGCDFAGSVLLFFGVLGILDQL